MTLTDEQRDKAARFSQSMREATAKNEPLSAADYFLIYVLLKEIAETKQ